MARNVASSRIRFATWAYMVIIAPSTAPMLKTKVTNNPSIRMKVVSPTDCSSQ